jgi:hypothetical protein
MGSRQVLTGVTVTWNDADAAKHRKFEFKDGPRNKSEIPRSEYDEFHPSRIVVDLKLDVGNSSVLTVTLDKAHLKIAYSIPAGKSDPPMVGWYNGAKWVKFEKFVYANNAFDVTLPPSWPTDPAIGVGP